MHRGTDDRSLEPIVFRLPLGQHVQVRATGQRGVVADVLSGERYLVTFDHGGVAICEWSELRALPNR